MCAILGFSSVILQISKPVTAVMKMPLAMAVFSMDFVEVHSAAKVCLSFCA